MMLKSSAGVLMDLDIIIALEYEKRGGGRFLEHRLSICTDGPPCSS
jgi:hypothetical protein